MEGLHEQVAPDPSLHAAVLANVVVLYAVVLHQRGTGCPEASRLPPAAPSLWGGLPGSALAASPPSCRPLWAPGAPPFARCGTMLRRSMPSWGCALCCTSTLR